MTRFWWRDDDAGADEPRLDTLLALARRHAVPVVLAVIPATLTAGTIRKIQACPEATVVQHGLAHRDHGSADGRKAELVDRIDQGAALAAARERLQAIFGAQFRPVMVPPWNRIEPEAEAGLPGLGFRAVSTFAGTRRRPAVPGLLRIDTQLDLIAWQEGKRALTLAEILAGIDARGALPLLGLLTHHAVTDDAGFAALDGLFRHLQGRPGAAFVSGAGLFGEGR